MTRCLFRLIWERERERERERKKERKKYQLSRQEFAYYQEWLLLHFFIEGKCSSSRPTASSQVAPSMSGSSLSLINALAACCLSQWLRPSHREWAAVELVKTLAGRSSKDGDRLGSVSADLHGKCTTYSSFTKQKWRLLISVPLTKQVNPITWFKICENQWFR